MEFFIFSGIALLIVLLNKVLRKYFSVLSTLAIFAFLGYQFYLSSTYDREPTKSENKTEKKANSYNKTNSNTNLNSNLNSKTSPYNYQDHNFKQNTSPSLKSSTTVQRSSSNNYYRSNTTQSRVRIGAVCNDGTTSKATGRGACSHHGGVAYWLYQ